MHTKGIFFMDTQPYLDQNREKKFGRVLSAIPDNFSQARLNRFRLTMERHIGKGKIPGLVTLVSHRDREYTDALGTMAFDSDKPIKRDTLFRLASTTKPITAVAAMI